MTNVTSAAAHASRGLDAMNVAPAASTTGAVAALCVRFHTIHGRVPP